MIVHPLDKRTPYNVFIDSRAINKPARHGDIVVVRLSTWPSRIQSACGYIEEVVGAVDDKGIDSEIICRKYDIRTVFSAAALEEARALGRSGNLPDLGPLHRRDLTDLLTFTIDPPDAKDFDDALSAEYVDGQLLLGVHIADVSSFVFLGSALDDEARIRATSVYLPDRVVPMLPDELSNGLCSLKVGEDRFCVSVLMLMGQDGHVLSSEFFASTIHSAARLSYDQVDAFLVGQPTDSRRSEERTDDQGPTDEQASDSGLSTITPEIGERLKSLDRMARRLKTRRITRGAIDFDSDEAKVILDSQGKPSGVSLRTSTAATSLVEEAMILANEQVAAYMMADDTPMLYRVHEEPALTALEEASTLLFKLGILKSPGPLVGSADIQKAISATLNTSSHLLTSSVLLRAMRRARYAVDFIGHFGLASSAYCHFTSPIRRYPDLVVHRLLKSKLSGNSVPMAFTNQLPLIAEHSSTREYAAEAATREATNAKLVEYLSDSVDQRFQVTVTGVSNIGLFVRDPKTTAEGLIPKDSLPKSMYYNEEGYCYTNPSGNRVLVLGQDIDVRLTRADTARSRLDFEVIW